MYQKIDVESGSACTPLYPMMLESPELQWAFIRKIYSIVTVQLLLTIAVAAAVVTVEPISVFFTTTYTGLALYIVLIITPFIAVLWPLAYHYKRHPVNYFHCCLGFCSAIDVCFYQRSNADYKDSMNAAEIGSSSFLAKRIEHQGPGRT